MEHQGAWSQHPAYRRLWQYDRQHSEKTDVLNLPAHKLCDLESVPCTPDLEPDPQEWAERAEDIRFVRAVGSLIPSREWALLRHLYGIGYEREHTYEETAKVFGVTRTRVAQIKDRAFLLLRRTKLCRARVRAEMDAEAEAIYLAQPR